MTQRVTSLKTRTAFAMSCVIVAVLVVNALYLILAKRSELRQDIVTRADLFARLTRQPICVGYDLYYSSGFYKFREVMREYLQLEPNIDRVRIVGVSGKVMFDSAELDESGPREEGGPERMIQDPQLLEAVKGLEITHLRLPDGAGGESLEIVAPYLEDWGRHRLSVTYRVTFRTLGPSIARLVFATAGLTLVSIVLAVWVAVALASRITRPLEELTSGALGIAEGHFDRRLDIRSRDELQILAEAFNDMSARLKENVEQLEESNKKLAQVNEELKELDRLKSDLLANVSHELRTPLTAIKGYTDYILDRKLGPITEKQEKGLVVVGRNLERLSKSINALLDFSRMDLGRIVLNLQPFTLTQLVEQIVTTLRAELERKRLAFELHVESQLPQVVGDRERLGQVFENLIINAMKFTPEGGRIAVHAVRSSLGSRPGVEVRVRDTGIGIPPAQLDKIFHRFYQVDGSSTRRYGGVGLGLSIVKTILDAHGTAVSVSSEEGRGTEFRFVLPAVEKGAVREARPPLPVEGVVLVVDDDPAFRETMQAQLEAEGFQVLTAATAGEGRELARRRRPDAIVLDVLLPDQDGLDLLRELKQGPETAGIPVLIVSVSESGLRAFTLGAAEWLRKPLDRSEVAATLRRLVNGRGSEEPLVLVADDEPDTADLIRDALRAEGFRVTVARDGQEALEALEQRRPDVMLLDIMMPRLSGFEVLEAVGRSPRLRGLPVVILSARSDDSDRQRGLELGARRILCKPFDVRSLVAEIRQQAGPRPAGTGWAGL